MSLLGFVYYTAQFAYFVYLGYFRVFWLCQWNLHSDCLTKQCCTFKDGRNANTMHGNNNNILRAYKSPCTRCHAFRCEWTGQFEATGISLYINSVYACLPLFFKQLKELREEVFFCKKKGIVVNTPDWDLVHTGSTRALCWISYGNMASDLGFESQKCLVAYPTDFLGRQASLRIWPWDSSARRAILSHFTNML